jgi:hypothetical protein
MIQRREADLVRQLVEAYISELCHLNNKYATIVGDTDVSQAALESLVLGLWAAGGVLAYRQRQKLLRDGVTETRLKQAWTAALAKMMELPSSHPFVC